VEGVKFAHGSLRPIRGEAYRALLVAGIAGLFVSFANPNTYHAWDSLFTQGQPQGHAVTIAEYLSTIEVLRTYRNFIVVVYWALMLLAVVAVVASVKFIDLTNAVLLAASGYFAFRHLRYVPVFLIVALPVIGRFLSLGTRARFARPPLIACALALVLVFATDELHGLERLRTGDWVDRAVFPVEAVDFIVASGLRGNIFNFYDWGGYLIWRLASKSKIFVDGRNINQERHWQAWIIYLGFEGGGQRTWKTLLDNNGVDVTITPLRRSGAAFPIVERLRGDSDWTALWSDDYAIVFVRSSVVHGWAAAPGK
jgi:hypothetical protein